MRLGWKVFLPMSLFMVVIVAAVLQFGGDGAEMSEWDHGPVGSGTRRSRRLERPLACQRAARSRRGGAVARSDRSENRADRAVLERKILALRWIVVRSRQRLFAILGFGSGHGCSRSAARWALTGSGRTMRLAFFF
jgi:hypothetical protein